MKRTLGIVGMVIGLVFSQTALAAGEIATGLAAGREVRDRFRSNVTPGDTTAYGLVLQTIRNRCGGYTGESRALCHLMAYDQLCRGRAYFGRAMCVSLQGALAISLADASTPHAVQTASESRSVLDDVHF